MALKLYGYWRSSATYRVRIGLNLKQLDYDIQPVHLVNQGGEQHLEAYQRLNPAELVPSLVDDDEDVILNQSLSILEYLDERYSSGQSLLPQHALERARIRTFVQDIACDIQPLANLRVLTHLEANYLSEGQDKADWARHWMSQGMDVLEQRLQLHATDYCFGFEVSLADVVLVPQVYNARRFNLDMSRYPLINRIYDNCMALPAFDKARPENQPDAQ